ncbi:MAG: methyltransferase domain-containing protein [Pseudomonadota bacterium]
MTQQTPPRIIEKQRLVRAKKRARKRLETIAGAGFLLDYLAHDLSLRLAVVQRRFDRALLISPNDEAIANATRQSVSGMMHQLDDRHMHEEVLAVDDSGFDLIVSLGQLHLVDDVPGMLLQLRRKLRPDGLLLVCVPGSKSLENIRAAWTQAEAETTGGLASRFLPLFDVRAAGSLLQRTGFALPVTDSDELRVNYRNAGDIFADLRSVAAGNVLAAGQGHALKRSVWARFLELIEDDRDSVSKIPVIFEFVWMSGWSPSPTQQQPLKPGSAQVSLTKVLKPS